MILGLSMCHVSVVSAHFFGKRWAKCVSPILFNDTVITAPAPLSNVMHQPENQSVADELQAKGEQTKVDLEVIAAYITDFSAIVSDFEKKIKKGGEKAKSPGEANPDDAY